METNDVQADEKEEMSIRPSWLPELMIFILLPLAAWCLFKGSGMDVSDTPLPFYAVFAGVIALQVVAILLTRTDDKESAEDE